MEKMINLKDLLTHEILDLYSAEEQIIEALPAMIDKAQNGALKKVLQQHLKVTETQKKRLDKVKELMSEGQEQSGQAEEKQGFFSRLFGGFNGSQKCRGMEGLIEEGEKVMAEDMSTEALDAAIIASAQKIEHYEISGYGTARAYARELKLNEVEDLLKQTLNEEYEADDQLTELAVGKLNIEAEQANEMTKGENRDINMKEERSSVKSETRQGSKSSSEKNTLRRSTSSDEKKASSAKGGSSKKTSLSTKANNSKSGNTRESAQKSGGNNNKKSASKSSASKNKKTASKSKSASKNR